MSLHIRKARGTIRSTFTNGGGRAWITIGFRKTKQDYFYYSKYITSPFNNCQTTCWGNIKNMIGHIGPVTFTWILYSIYLKTRKRIHILDIKQSHITAIKRLFRPHLARIDGKIEWYEMKYISTNKTPMVIVRLVIDTAKLQEAYDKIQKPEGRFIIQASN